jgi:hypothetical protein
VGYLCRRCTADLFVVGGAAMAQACDVERVTRDVDAMFAPAALSEVEVAADS